MPHTFDTLEHHLLKAFQQALSDNRMDVADHLFYALEALDPEYDGPALQHACKAIVGKTDDLTDQHR